MNKAHKPFRKSGGRAWKEISDDLEILIELINLLDEFRRLPKAVKLKQPGFEEYLRFVGLGDSDELPSGDFIKNRVENFIRSSHLNPEFIVFKMRWLKEVVCLMPEKLALDIINYCPAYKAAGAEELLSFMKIDDGFNAFANVFIEDEEDQMTQSAERNFLFSMHRYQELSLISSLLRVIIPSWQKHQNDIKENILKNPGRLFSPEFAFPAEIVSHIKVGLTSDFKLKIHLGSGFEALSSSDFDRIRICQQCDKIFWAGRKDMSGCSRCSVIIRRKRWRDKRDSITEVIRRAGDNNK
jgi:hypothetical protein